MADNKESLRALKIKTGIMTRVKKELAMYRQEVETEGAKLEKMKAEGRDPFDIKQQDQVLGESSMMIGDCKTRMENAFNDLLAAVVRARHREPARPNPTPSSPRVPTRGGPRSDTRRPFRCQDEHGEACDGSEELAAAKAILDEVEPLIEDN